MSWNLYIVPVTHIDLSGGREFAAPSFFWGRLTTGLPELEGVQWYWERMVWENHGIVAADTTTTQHTLLDSQTGVIAIPDLNNTISNATVLSRVQNILEAGNIPANWLSVGMSYREVVRTILNTWRFFNRYVSKGGKVFVTGITLDTTMAELPALAVQRLQETATEFNLDYSQVTGSTTIRQVLNGMADQFGDLEYVLGGVVI